MKVEAADTGALGLSRGACLLLALLLATLLPSPAGAQGDDARQEGDPVGEPAGEMGAVSVARQLLLIDMRPLQRARPVSITATYELRNERAREVPLLLVAPATGEDVRVLLDGGPVRPAPRPVGGPPPGWRPPGTTPAIDGGAPIPYAVREGRSLEVRLPRGAHQLEVGYEAEAGSYAGDSPLRVWQLGWALAPARRWASFGGMDVVVQLPPGWKAASEPGLSRTQDVLSGSFREVPADALALSVQAAPPRSLPVAPIAAVGLALLAALAWLGGRLLRLRGRAVLPLAAGLSLSWALAVFLSISLADPARGVPPEQLARGYDSGAGRWALASATVAFLAGIPLASLAAARGRRSRR